MRQNATCFGYLTLITLLTVSSSGWAAAIPGPLPGEDTLPPSPEARLAWQLTVPIRATDTIKSWHLVEGYLYAIGGEGTVHCVRADTGELLWSRRLLDAPGVIYPPVAYRSQEFYAVAFTLPTQVILLDPNTGSEYKRVDLKSPATNSCSSSPGFIYSSETNRRLRAYDIKAKVQTWQILGEGETTVSPAYQPDIQTVVLADGGGMVAMVWASDKEKVYARKLGGGVAGGIASDEANLYVATSDNLVNCLNRVSGETLWQYRLPARPEGGPVIYRGSVYQVVAPVGLQRIGIDRDRPNWFDPDAVQFLTEWDGRPVVLHQDRRVAILDPLTGKPVAFARTGRVADAVTNTANDALLLVSPAGEARCLQPVGASPGALASFFPPTTQPTTQPAAGDGTTTQPTTRPALVRPEKKEEEPLWVRSSGSAQDKGTGQARSSRSSSRSGDRSARSSRSSRSSRGESGSRSSRSSRSGSSGSHSSHSSRSSRGNAP